MSPKTSIRKNHECSCVIGSEILSTRFSFFFNVLDMNLQQIVNSDFPLFVTVLIFKIDAYIDVTENASIIFHTHPLSYLRSFSDDFDFVFKREWCSIFQNEEYL